jgi:hypothetical protein
MNSTGKSKAGYGKIQFCGEQARRDGLQYSLVVSRLLIAEIVKYLDYFEFLNL